MTTPWKWTPERTLGIWRHGAPWLRPIVAAAPYITVVLLLLMMHVAGSAMTAAARKNSNLFISLFNVYGFAV